jgi:C-terminal processing protease CtpA/Prc
MSEEAGLKPGDVLLAVDGDDITNVSYEGVRAALRGPVGSKAVLTVKRGAEIIEITVERRFIKEDNKGAKTD